MLYVCVRRTYSKSKRTTRTPVRQVLPMEIQNRWSRHPETIYPCVTGINSARKERRISAKNLWRVNSGFVLRGGRAPLGESAVARRCEYMGLVVKRARKMGRRRVYLYSRATGPARERGHVVVVAFSVGDFWVGRRCSLVVVPRVSGTLSSAVSAILPPFMTTVAPTTSSPSIFIPETLLSRDGVKIAVCRESFS